MLYLISLGLWDEKDMSIRALETAKKCDLLYAEFYTNRANTNVKNLEKLVGKPVRELDRHDMEEGSTALLREARERDVGIFVPGDALTATTHVSLLLEAENKGVKADIIHGSSIVSAVGETGLQLYKFGRITTLTDPVPMSCFEAIENNQNARLHTLVLLDIGMTARRGLELLKSMVDGPVIMASCLGGNGKIKYGGIDELLGLRDIDYEPAVIIIPGELHFMEKEYLESLR